MISVIVAIYNAHKYLKECIESICGQTTEDLEIILVNDGSTDDSGEICKSFEKIDNRIIIADKPNGGVSSARNEGLRRVSGEWVTFVDSDDYLDDNVLEKALKQANDNPQELAIWNATEVRGEQIKKCEPIHIADNGHEENLAAIIADYHKNFYLGKYIRAVWGKLFRTETIRKHDLEFDERLYIGEDALFLAQYMEYVDGFAPVDSFGYYYRHLPTSAVRRYKADFFDQCRMQVEAFETLSKRYKNSNIINEAMSVMRWEMLRGLVQNGEKGYRQGMLLKKQRNDAAKQWYDIMRNENVAKMTPWSRKLVRIQSAIGNKVPFALHRLMIDMYDVLKGGKIT